MIRKFSFRLETTSEPVRSASRAGGVIILAVCLTALLWSIISDEPTRLLEQETADEAKVKHHTT